jgi:putative Holliday junction resolvase
LDRDIGHIAALVGSHSVERVVLGLPLQLDGHEGIAVQAMRAFVVKLEAGLSVPVVLWDERMTTKAAEDLLIAADVSRKKRKGAIDRIAAAILLQSYLAAQAPVSTTVPPDGAADAYDDWESQDQRSHETARDPNPRSGHRRTRRAGSIPDDSLD